MKYPVSEIKDYMQNWAKDEYQLSWDNSGSQIEFKEKTDSVVLGLDLTDNLVEKAIETNSKLIITHHPMFFSGTKSIIEGSYLGDNIIKLIKNNISVFSYHTSMDIANNGVNDTLFEKLNLMNKKVLAREEEKSMGLVGDLSKSYTTEKLKKFLQDSLDYKKIKIYGKENNNIRKVAILGGSGADFISDAVRSGSDAFITGDIKYHDGQRAYENGILVFDVGHFCSEKMILEKIKNNLEKNFKNLNFYIEEGNSYDLDI